MIILHFQVKIKASVEIPVIKPHCENQIIAVILVDKGNILAQSKLRDQRLPASSPYLKTWMDSCCAHVSVIVYRTAKVLSMTTYYCLDSLVTVFLTCFMVFLHLLQLPYSPSCKSQRTVAGPKNTHPLTMFWDTSFCQLPDTFESTFWLIFASPISFSLSYVILTWLCQNLIWHLGPIAPFSKSYIRVTFSAALIYKLYWCESNKIVFFFSFLLLSQPVSNST